MSDWELPSLQKYSRHVPVQELPSIFHVDFLPFTISKTQTFFSGEDSKINPKFVCLFSKWVLNGSEYQYLKWNYSKMMTAFKGIKHLGHLFNFYWKQKNHAF